MTNGAMFAPLVTPVLSRGPGVHAMFAPLVILAAGPVHSGFPLARE
jgi:hypothetical protein